MVAPRRTNNLWVMPMLVLMILMLASLGCLSLQRKGADDEKPTPAAESAQQTLNAVANDPTNNTPPTIQVTQPQNGQQVTVGQRVDVIVHAEHPVTVSRIQMSVNGRISSSKSLPPNSTIADVVLGWLPDRTGTYTLEVVAYYRDVASQIATVNLEVLEEGAIANNPASGQADQPTPQVGTCNARVMIGNLNFRKGPGENFDKLGSFNLNEPLSASGRNVDSQNRTWLKIRRANGQEGWVVSEPQWLETQGDCNSLPVVSS
ncbi:MAG: SH3 domain-containing protein [Chloroflexi bacterium]|nr:SH3 domain-containing protein [Chloroflexota bacterium]